MRLVGGFVGTSGIHPGHPGIDGTHGGSGGAVIAGSYIPPLHIAVSCQAALRHLASLGPTGGHVAPNGSSAQSGESGSAILLVAS
ncbi:MAG: hypothetical protein ACRDUS_09265 [Mycobacterium sp.]